jgi:hypothetical protein
LRTSTRTSDGGLTATVVAVVGPDVVVVVCAVVEVVVLTVEDVDVAAVEAVVVGGSPPSKADNKK